MARLLRPNTPGIHSKINLSDVVVEVFCSGQQFERMAFEKRPLTKLRLF